MSSFPPSLAILLFNVVILVAIIIKVVFLCDKKNKEPRFFAALCIIIHFIPGFIENGFFKSYFEPTSSNRFWALLLASNSLCLIYYFILKQIWKTKHSKLKRDKQRDDILDDL